MRSVSKKHELTILLIEDNDDHAELILRCLKDNSVGRSFIRCAEANDALDKLRKGKIDGTGYPDLIILDIKLPGMDGFEFLEIIQKEEIIGRIPIVILTTSDAEKDVKKAYDFNVNSYLVKPMEFDSFMTMLEDFSDFWFNWNYYTNISEH